MLRILSLACAEGAKSADGEAATAGSSAMPGTFSTGCWLQQPGQPGLLSPNPVLDATRLRSRSARAQMCLAPAACHPVATASTDLLW